MTLSPGSARDASADAPIRGRSFASGALRARSGARSTTQGASARRSPSAPSAAPIRRASSRSCVRTCRERCVRASKRASTRSSPSFGLVLGPLHRPSTARAGRLGGETSRRSTNASGGPGRPLSVVEGSLNKAQRRYREGHHRVVAAMGASGCAVCARGQRQPRGPGGTEDPVTTSSALGARARSAASLSGRVFCGVIGGDQRCEGVHGHPAMS